VRKERAIISVENSRRTSGQAEEKLDMPGTCQRLDESRLKKGIFLVG